MTTALVPEVKRLPAARPCTTPDEARRFAAVLVKGRTVMATLKCERKSFASSDFIAKVVNDSDEELSCIVNGWTHRGVIPIAPHSFWIKPHSLAQVAIHAPLLVPAPLRTLSLQLQSSSMRASAEADVPMPALLRLAWAAGIIVSLAAGTLAFRQAALPRVVAYTLPSRVAAGDSVSAAYTVSGIGTAEYEVTSGGAQVAGGILQDRSGSFSFPTSKEAGTYRVTLSVLGPLGRAQRQLATTAMPIAQSAALSIAALQPDPGVVRGGQRINVRYISNAQHGKVTLYDASGIVLQRVAYNASGVSVLKAPSVTVPTQYRVELRVASGSATTNASAGLLVLPNNDGTPNAPAGTLTAGQLLTLPQYVISASTFAVRLLAHPENLRLTFEDEQGTPLETQIVSSDQSFAYFTAPNIAHDGSYVIDASFSIGNAQQDVLQRVKVHRAG